MIHKKKCVCGHLLDVEDAYQQGRKDAIEELLGKIEDADYISIDKLVEITEQIKEQKNEKYDV